MLRARLQPCLSCPVRRAASAAEVHFLPAPTSQRFVRTQSACASENLWRTSDPRNQKITSSAMLVAWSAARSRLRATMIAFSACPLTLAFPASSRRVRSGRCGSCRRSHRPWPARTRPASRRLRARPEWSANHYPDLISHLRDVDGQGDGGRLCSGWMRGEMLVAWSPMRSRSPLILMTARMKRDRWPWAAPWRADRTPSHRHRARRS